MTLGGRSEDRLANRYPLPGTTVIDSHLGIPEASIRELASATSPNLKVTYT